MKKQNEFDAKSLLVDFLEDEMSEAEHRVVQAEIMSSADSRRDLRSLSETRELLRIGMQVPEHDVDLVDLHDSIMFQIDNLEQIDRLMERKKRNAAQEMSIKNTVDQTLYKIHTQLKVL